MRVLAKMLPYLALVLLAACLSKHKREDPATPVVDKPSKFDLDDKGPTVADVYEQSKKNLGLALAEYQASEDYKQSLVSSDPQDQAYVLQVSALSTLTADDLRTIAKSGMFSNSYCNMPKLLAVETAIQLKQPEQTLPDDQQPAYCLQQLKAQKEAGTGAGLALAGSGNNGNNNTNDNKAGIGIFIWLALPVLSLGGFAYHINAIDNENKGENNGEIKISQTLREALGRLGASIISVATPDASPSVTAKNKLVKMLSTVKTYIAGDADKTAVKPSEIAGAVFIFVPLMTALSLGVDAMVQNGLSQSTITLMQTSLGVVGAAALGVGILNLHTAYEMKGEKLTLKSTRMTATSKGIAGISIAALAATGVGTLSLAEGEVSARETFSKALYTELGRLASAD